jgi:hypothetical protein
MSSGSLSLVRFDGAGGTWQHERPGARNAALLFLRVENAGGRGKLK